VENGFDVSALGEAEFRAGLFDGADVFVHEQRVARLDFRRFAVLVEMERVIGAVEIIPPLTPPPAPVCDACARPLNLASGAHFDLLRSEHDPRSLSTSVTVSGLC
jgi:hypothetical protein